MSRRTFQISVLLMAVVSGGLVAAACAQGISQADYDAVKQQLAAKDKEAADVQQKLAAAQKEGTESKGKVIVGAIPDAPLRATPTATPVGFQAPPPPQPLAPEVKALFLDVKTVTAGPGESQFKVDADKYCAVSSTFKRGMHVVWLMEAYDAATGKELQTADVKEAVLKLPTGESANFRYGRHGATEDSPWFWSTAWDVPMNYPLGVLDYTVEVTTVVGKKDTYKVWGAYRAGPPLLTPMLNIID